jgi:NAD(P)-dependent dehydrogenase (short-subunit alcohol dehydrogenase family)
MNVLDSFRLDGRKALVTGGSKGLGQVIATALAQAGADVAIVSRTKDDCEFASNQIAESTGRRVAYATADLTDGHQVAQAIDDIQSNLGAIDILVNNAGVNTRGLAQELTEADFDAVIAINLKAPFLCSRILGPQMCERGWGRVINLGSILSYVAIAGRAPYCSAKAGVVNLTRVLALEWAQSGVTVNAICPGPFATEMNKPLLDDPEKYKAFVSKIPMGRWGELNEIAGAAVFLASEASSFVTGSSLFVDGGWTAQ